MKHVGHFIAGELQPADDGSQIFNPSNGKPTESQRSYTGRSPTGCRCRPRCLSGLVRTGAAECATVMLELRGALQKARDELVDIVVAELGKTLADAGAEVDRAIECWASWLDRAVGTVAV